MTMYNIGITLQLLGHILSVNEKLPPLKFQYFEKYKISFKHCSFIHVSGQPHIDLETFNSFTSLGTTVHEQHVQFVIFELFEN